MTFRTTITLDKEAYEFMVAIGVKNRSAYISQLIKEQQRRMLAQAIEQANKEEKEDQEYQNHLAEWEVTLEDGLG